jgi:hypothetical protein
MDLAAFRASEFGQDIRTTGLTLDSFIQYDLSRVMLRGKVRNFAGQLVEQERQ